MRTTAIAILALLFSCARAEVRRAPLRVCADPDNMPFSNMQQRGFENRIAQLIARDWQRPLQYTWFPQRRGFARLTLKEHDCDVIIGVPSNYEPAATTRPYYRSSYLFVSRTDRHLDIRSFDDPRLHHLKIGVQIIGNDHVNSPPAHALAARGIIDNIAGYPIYDAQKDIVSAVARGDVDLAVVWGPQAAWSARSQRVALDLVPVSPQIDLPFLPFVFDISMGVRRGDTALREQLDQEIERRQVEIQKILDEYGVPRV